MQLHLLVRTGFFHLSMNTRCNSARHPISPGSWTCFIKAAPFNLKKKKSTFAKGIKEKSTTAAEEEQFLQTLKLVLSIRNNKRNSKLGDGKQQNL